MELYFFSSTCCEQIRLLLLLGFLLFAPINAYVPAACTVFTKPGHLSVAGIFPFRYSPTGSVCNEASGLSPWGLRCAESMIWAIEDINSRDDILPNITLGYEIRDDCRSEDIALWSTLSLFVDTCPGAANITDKSTLIGIIGGFWSSTTVWMAKVGNLFQVPLISYSATSDELSDTVRFPYFFRTIPPDRFQVGAIIDILLRFNWRYIALIYSTDTYGISGGRQIRSEAEANDICIALSASIQPYAPKYEVDEVLNKLLKVPKVKVAVIFSLSTVAYTFLSAIKSQGLKLNITWIGSDGWGGSSMWKTHGLGNIVMGAFFLRVVNSEPKRFTDYFGDLTADTHSGNPWFNTYWDEQRKHNCTTTVECQFPQYTQGRIINGVRALAYALDTMLKDKCFGQDCILSKNHIGMELTDYLYNVSFNSTDGSRFIFDNSGDAAGVYRIDNLQRNGDEYWFDTVGFWDPRDVESALTIDLDRIQFHGESKNVPFALCRDQCKPGQVIVPLEEKCCFGCQTCQVNAIVNESKCQECHPTHWPNSDFNKCNKIKPSSVQWNDPFIMIIIALASFGLTLSISVIVGLLVHKNHPLVKATSRELSGVNVTGLTIAFIDAFIFIIHPTQSVCLLAECLLSLSFTVIIVPTLLKVIRIYRIFRAGKKSVRRPRFVGIRDQLFMTAILILLQVILLIIFSSIYLPKPELVFTQPPQNYIGVYCKLGISFYVSSIYNLILIVVCCYYAFLARKVPSNYNESKFIGISVYSMLIVTLAAIPLYSTAENVLQKVTTVSAGLLLNAYLGLVCVYLPKLYAVYFKGDEVEVEDWRTASVRTMTGSSRSAQVHPSLES